MKFKHTSNQEDGGGSLTVTADTPTEALEIIEHFRVFDKDTVEGIKEIARALSTCNGVGFSYESNPTKRKWYKFQSSLGLEFCQPYVDLLKRITGFDCGILPDLPLTDLHPRRLCHTHITDEIWLHHGHISFVGYIQSEDWDGRRADERAPEYLVDYIQEDFGFRPFEREFIEHGGIARRNPNYLKRHKAKPGLGAPWFWKAIFQWWRDNHASPQQIDILIKVNELRSSRGFEDDWEIRESGAEQCNLVGFSLYYRDPNGRIDWDGKGTKASCISWEEFAKLGKDQHA